MALTTMRGHWVVTSNRLASLVSITVAKSSPTARCGWSKCRRRPIRGGENGTAAVAC
jgi:hypothetical protein